MGVLADERLVRDLRRSAPRQGRQHVAAVGVLRLQDHERTGCQAGRRQDGAVVRHDIQGGRTVRGCPRRCLARVLDRRARGKRERLQPRAICVGREEIHRAARRLHARPARALVRVRAVHHLGSQASMAQAEGLQGHARVSERTRGRLRADDRPALDAVPGSTNSRPRASCRPPTAA